MKILWDVTIKYFILDASNNFELIACDTSRKKFHNENNNKVSKNHKLTCEYEHIKRAKPLFGKPFIANDK